MATPSKHQVLVVDDDPSVRETVALLLMSAGYDVAAAEDGFGALLQLRKMLPDLIISDLNMPHMSGFELLSVVRRRFPEILTVAMSGACRNSDELPPEVICGGLLRQRRASHKPFWNSRAATSYWPSAPRRPSPAARSSLDPSQRE